MAGDSLEFLRKRAKDALSRGQYEDALNIYQRALLFHNDNQEIHYGIATVYFMLGNLEHAVEHFKTVIHLDPFRANAHINLGALYHRLGQYDDSLAHLRRGIQLDATRAEAHYNLGLIYKHFGEVNLAIEAYHEAIRLNPRLYEAHLNLGNLFRDKHDATQAIDHYRQALELRPTCDKAKLALETVWAEHGSAPNGKPVMASPPAPAPAAVPFDPDRQIDPVLHGNLLRELHHKIIDVDGLSQVLLNCVRRSVEESIRTLSICVLTPNDPRHSLDEEMRKFDEMVIKLQQLHEALQKRMVQTKAMSEQTMKT